MADPGAIITFGVVKKEINIVLTGMVLSALLCMVSTNAHSQTGQLNGNSLKLYSNNGNGIVINLPSGLSSSFTLPLPSAGSFSDTARYLYDSSGVLKWGSPPTNPASTGAVIDSVRSLQTTSTNSNYLFDVSYPPSATGPLLGASIVSQTDDQDNNPTFACNEIVARDTTTGATGVTVTGMKVNVVDSGSGTNIGVQAEAYGLSNNYAMILNGGNVGIGTSAPQQSLEVKGNIRISGTNGLVIEEGGTSATKGSVTLTHGTATVSTKRVTANSRIFLTAGTSATNIGALWVSSRTSGTSFTINSAINSATGVPVSWMIVEPGP